MVGERGGGRAQRPREWYSKGRIVGSSTHCDSGEKWTEYYMLVEGSEGEVKLRTREVTAGKAKETIKVPVIMLFTGVNTLLSVIYLWVFNSYGLLSLFRSSLSVHGWRTGETRLCARGFHGCALAKYSITLFSNNTVS